MVFKLNSKLWKSGIHQSKDLKQVYQFMVLWKILACNNVHFGSKCDEMFTAFRYSRYTNKISKSSFFL